ncbi:hypothetical protein IZY60_15345 [Lutibacter sp. B2]|nr:hypothetical protein [Lutibacter sp. B2]
MKRIIKKREYAFKYAFIVMVIVLAYMNIQLFEDVVGRDNNKLIIPYSLYLGNVLSLISSIIEGKIVEYRVKNLKLQMIRPYKKASLVIYISVFVFLNIILWLLSMNFYMDTLIVIVIGIVIWNIETYMGGKVMYGEHDLVVGNKIYDIDCIKSIRDDFGSNLYIQVTDEEYPIYCGSPSAKQELTKMLEGKISKTRL